MPVRTLGPKGGGFGGGPTSIKGRSASEDDGPRRGVDLVAVPHRLKEGVSARTLDPEGGWIVMSHIDSIKGKSASEDARREEGWIVMSHISWEENKPPFKSL